MSDIKKLFKEDIIPTLTDFIDNQLVFWNAFEENKVLNCPIKNVLELGVYRLDYDKKSLFPGQSTKTLMALSQKYNIDKFVSLDIDDCSITIDNCKKWLLQYGFVPQNHSFIQCNSVHFDIIKEFPNGIDFIFLDTNHDDNFPERIGYKDAGGAGMTYKEISYYAPHLSINGRLFIHDTKTYYVEKAYGVNTDGAIEKFINENSEFDFHEHNTNIYGLGEIFRKDSLIKY